MLSFFCNLYIFFLISMLSRYASTGIKDEPECESAMFT